MVRVDESGDQLWNHTFGSPWGYAFGAGAAQTEDDGFAVFAGYYNPMTMPVFGGMWLIRLDDEGNHLWNISYENPPTDGSQHLGLAFTSCQDGGFGLLGTAEDPGGRHSNVPWIVRTAANGSILWNRVYRWSEPGPPGMDIGASISECSEGGFVVTGRTEYGELNAWLLRVDSEGNHLWNHTYEPAWLHGLAECNDDGFALAGFAYNESVSEPPSVPMVIRTDSQGNTLWEHTYGCGGDEGFASILELESGGFVLTGFTNSSVNGGRDMILARISPDGSLLWNLTVGGSAYDTGSSLVRLPGNGFAAAGSTASFGVGDLDMWLVRFPEPEGTPPTWVEPPIDQRILSGVPFRYALNASDSSGISRWQLNDTTDFVIDDEGCITNATVLAVGSYSLQVVVYDIYNNALSGAFKVLVVPDPLSIVIGISILVLVVLLPASFLVVLAWRRYSYSK
jgi:hypothetical protein